MGVHANIAHDKFPKQGAGVGKRVEVCFNDDTENTIGGEVVRDDIEEPHETIIRLDDNRYVLGSECQYRHAKGEDLGEVG